MHYSLLLAGFLFSSAITALESPHRRAPAKHAKRKAIETKNAPRKRQTSTYFNSKTAKFAVNGSAIPDVDFNIGESYAGTLSINSNASSPNSLWFWLFPSENPAASNEITLWLNEALDVPHWTDFFRSMGRFSGSQAFTHPFKIRFWKNLFDTFDLHGSKVYITGESYAGQYCPYIAAAMLDQNDTEYYNVKGMQINDPSINYDDTLLEAPAVMYLNHFSEVFNLNETFMADINNRSEICGYNAFMENTLTFPPTGPIPTAPNSSLPGCDVWDDITTAAVYVNPCFNIYHIIDCCPFLWDQLGFPSLGWSPNDYFNRSDVQKAINAPPTDYLVCGNDNLGLLIPGDASVPSALGPLPSVIERTNNVIISHGMLDYLLIANGSLATIHNMTWNGKQGFQTAPSTTLKFYVPYHQNLDEIIYEIETQPLPAASQTDVAGAGLLGVTHTERGLTFVTTVNHAGHEIPEYVPGAAYRQLEFLLGRISSLEQRGDYTTQSGNFTGTAPPSRHK